MKRFTLTEILSMKTIEQAHTDDLILWHPCGIKVWVSRLTRMDGMPYDNQVTVERLVDGTWTEIDQYRPI